MALRLVLIELWCLNDGESGGKPTRFFSSLSFNAKDVCATDMALLMTLSLISLIHGSAVLSENKISQGIFNININWTFNTCK